MHKKQKRNLLRILAAAALMVLLSRLELSPAVRMALYFIPYLIVGYDILWKAAVGIKNRRPFDESLLMSVATIGAMTIAVFENGDYTEGIAVMLFYQVGEWFQSYAVGKSRRDISALMDIRPDYANIETDGALERVDPDEVEVGSVIVVRPGEKIPLDGIVIEGASTLNTSALTGESLPREIGKGGEALSGCINMTGVLRIQTTKEFDESTASKILELVEDASSRKAKVENFITRFARVYTPIVVWLAVALAALPPLANMLVYGAEPAWGTWIYRALVFLVISCPCALVVSVPLSFFAGLGGASRAGVLIKGANYLEALAEVRTIVFDKTGTLTRGVFEVNDIHHAAMEKKKLIEYAALAESASSHPISRSLQQAYGGIIDRSRVQDVEEISGQGITALVDGIRVAAGNGRLMQTLGIDYHECSHVGTIIHMAIDGAYAGHIVIADQLKDTAKEGIAALHKAGIERTVMLTGDLRSVAEVVAAEVGVDEVRSELLPDGKVTEMERIIETPHRGKVAFVGDGINDAPVLSRADVGIAMGAMGSDAAIEAADVVLMDDSPLTLAKAVRISQNTMSIVRQNIWGAIGIKVVVLFLGAIGIANMWFAIFADVGVTVIAVLNALRALMVAKNKALGQRENSALVPQAAAS